MQQPTLIQIAQQMMQRVVQSGQAPVCFMMNANTSRAISETMVVECKKRMSLFDRFMFWARKRNIAPRLETLCGIPVVISPMMQDGGLFLSSMGNAPGFSQPQGQHAPQAAPAQPNPPAEFVKREAVSQADGAGGDVRPTLDDLSQGSGDRPSSSDVLMKAMDGAENLMGVVVVRVHRNGDVDLCLNTNQFETQGVLQRAQQWLMMRGY